MARTIVIGDIHGCFDELQALLDAVAPAVDDRIIAIGDIVDRGPDSEKVLEFFRDTPNTMSIMGNHERKHIRSARGEIRPALSQIIVREQLGERYPEWLAFMESFPRYLELPEAILVHGFFEPGISLEQQRDTVVIGTLSGEKHMTETYAGPWYEHYRGPKPLVFGHHDYLRTGEPLVKEGLLYGIDTGAPFGGRLTAFILPEFRIVSVPSRGDHWSEQRRRYAVLAVSSLSDQDLDWDRLKTFASCAGTKDLRVDQKERADRCVKIAACCDRIAGEILATVKALCRTTLDELTCASDWHQLSPQKQAARYAQRVGQHPAMHLLFAAKRGELTKEMLLRRMNTPRELARTADNLGVGYDPQQLHDAIDA